MLLIQENIRQAALPHTTVLLIPVLTGVPKRQMVRLGALKGTNYFRARNAATSKAIPYAYDYIHYSEDLLVDGDASPLTNGVTSYLATGANANAYYRIPGN